MGVWVCGWMGVWVAGSAGIGAVAVRAVSRWVPQWPQKWKEAGIGAPQAGQWSVKGRPQWPQKRKECGIIAPHTAHGWSSDEPHWPQTLLSNPSCPGPAKDGGASRSRRGAARDWPITRGLGSPLLLLANQRLSV
jgi:hypothetical protein